MQTWTTTHLRLRSRALSQLNDYLRMTFPSCTALSISKGQSQADLILNVSFARTCSECRGSSVAFYAGDDLFHLLLYVQSYETGNLDLHPQDR